LINYDLVFKKEKNKEFNIWEKAYNKSIQELSLKPQYIISLNYIKCYFKLIE